MGHRQRRAEPAQGPPPGLLPRPLLRQRPLKNNADVFCANPVVYDVYLHYLAELEPHFALFMQYTHNGSHSSRNSWGAKEFIGQPRDVAHKYRALYDYAVKTGQYDPKDKTVRRIGTGSLGGK